MKLDIYIKDTIYKTVEIEHPEQYNVSEIIKMVHSDRDQGLIPNWAQGEKLPIKIVPVK